MLPEPRPRAPALAFVALAAFVVLLAVLASEVPLKFDDLDYLPDTLIHRDVRVAGGGGRRVVADVPAGSAPQGAPEGRPAVSARGAAR